MLSEDSLRRAVRAAGIDVPPRWHDEIGSTNTESLALARNGAPAWTVVAAAHQRAGRGRLGRGWVDAPGGSLLFSVLLRPGIDPSRAPVITLLAAVEMIAAIELSEVRSKWPNDLVIRDRKVGGILAEAEVTNGRVDHVVLGIGVNVRPWEGDPPAGAISLAAEAAGLDPEAILGRFLARLRGSFEEDPGLRLVPARYERICSTLGRRVTVAVPGTGEVEGRAVGIDPDGGLVLETPGDRSVVHSGEVLRLRDARRE